MYLWFDLFIILSLFWHARSPEDTSLFALTFEIYFLDNLVRGCTTVQTNEASKASFKSLNMEI